MASTKPPSKPSLGIADAIAETAAVLGRRWLVVGFYFVVLLITSVAGRFAAIHATRLFAPSGFGPDQMSFALAFAAIRAAAYVLLLPIGIAVAFDVFLRDFERLPITFKSCLRAIAVNYLPLVVLGLLSRFGGLLFVFVSSWSGPSMALGLLYGAVAVVVSWAVAAVLGGLFFVSLPVVIAQGRGPVFGLRKGFALARGYRGVLILIVAVWSIVVEAAVAISNYTIIGFYRDAAPAGTVWLPYLQLVVGAVPMAVFAVISFAFRTAIYRRLLAIKDGPKVADVFS